MLKYSLLRTYFKIYKGTSEKHVIESPGKTVINQTHRTLSHFFPGLAGDLSKLPDSRKRKQYQTTELCMAGISLFLFKQGSRNAYKNDRKETQFLQNYQTLFDMRLPHLDTPDEYFRNRYCQEGMFIIEKFVNVIPGFIQSFEKSLHFLMFIAEIAIQYFKSHLSNTAPIDI